ncbi:MAG TPA: alpha/beta hydrolase family protein [Terriglobales bacterium]|nr:alpha/beta hydrolase family protein [Terriglobales bacterium]
MKRVSIGGVDVQEVTFPSKSLGRPMRYLVLLPANYSDEPTVRYPTLILLHGGFGSPEDWLRSSHLGAYAQGLALVVVMPQGDNSYYVNAALRPADRYQDYMVDDLPSDLEAHYRTAPTNTAIAGVSMGGFGALNLGLKHPDQYWFVGSISNAADVPNRRFVFRRFRQSWRLRKTFGPEGSALRREKDPFVVIRSVTDPKRAPFVYQACGEADSLLGVNRQLNQALDSAHIRHVYRESPGGHDWNYWDRALSDMFSLLKQRGGPG